ncbi:PREDICTED: fatty acyl-CoA reductase 1-like [Nicrophorus vespilloides]|uniref:Fatty acyl-CoA reductase n=1 Tax=Nicrophorus vespilloides TaxID=110193 RepID=A0ABM1M1I3_NICVS|nr:PREDICTED: fatty acyl-CoA reductase 1-like [Nicrophorus vespilloides]
MSRFSEFFANKNVLITGGTGLFGMSIVEKLLRAFPKIGKINLLVRSTKNESLSQRASKYFDNEAFSRLKAKNGNGNLMDKIIWIEGDLSKPNMGLSPESVKHINETVNVIYHSAATVKFMEPLKNAIKLNVCGTNELLKIAKNCQNLKSFMYISTSFVNHRRSANRLDEKSYKHTVDPNLLIQMHDTMSSEEIELKKTEFLADFPNTYIFTKNAAEDLLHGNPGDLKIGVFRPGSIFRMHPKSPGNSTPVDLCTNALIAATCDSATSSENKKFYNFAVNSPSWLEQYEYYLDNVKDPWLAFGSLKYRFLSHMKDLVLEMNGTKGIYVREIEQHQKLIKLLEYFSTKEFHYSTDNIDAIWKTMSEEEKELLFFNLKDVNWKEYFGKMCDGNKHVLHDMLDIKQTMMALAR